MLLNIVGYYIDGDPKPMMMVLVRDTDAKDKSKKTVAPMIAECPSLRAKVRENRSRKGGNTQLLKQFDGGFLKLAGANSAANLRSDPITVLLLDEADGYPDDVDGEGDPVDIAERRLDSFDDAKVLIGSTPAKPKGASRIDDEFEVSDQRMFYVPCPFCEHKQPLLWRDPDTKEYNLVWDKDSTGAPIASTVRYRCRSCKEGIAERYKQIMLDRGTWIARYPERVAIAGFYINALYSPWKPIWPKLADEWFKAQDIPQKMRAFVNLRLGETWDEGAEAFDANLLPARREIYAAEVPMGVAVLVASVDVQLNRLEAKVTGFGPGFEEWHIDHQIFWGAPGLIPTSKENEDLANVWSELDEYLLKEWKHESGARLRPAITLVDTGAYADACAKFIQPRQNRHRRVYACKGVDYLTVPGLVQDSTAKKHKMRLFNVATHTAKDGIMLGLGVSKPGPGFMHFHMETTEEYFAQLTSERKMPVRSKRTGRTHYEWVVTGLRNEVLDLTVYARAGLAALQKFVDPKTYGDLRPVLTELQARKDEPPKPVVPRRRVFSEGIT